MRTKQWLTYLSFLLIFVLALAACGGAADETPADDGGDTPADTGGSEPEVEPEEEEEMEDDMEEEDDSAEMSGEVVTIEFWHAMGGELGEVVDELVARFNDSQSEVVVNSTYQGSYDDTYNALLAAFETDTEPNIIQNFDLASQTMIDTGRLIPAYQLMADDNYDSSIFVPAVADYYSNADGMMAMAFNSSTPILYYNIAMLEEAGVSPPPEGTSWSFSEMLAACDEIQASGVTPNCIALGQVGWYFEQILANSGGMYYDNNNGRTGRATQVAFDEGVGVEVFDFLTGLVANGYSPNLGNTWTDTDSVFFAGEAAMMFDSTSGARGLQDGAEFEVGTMFIPYADSAGDRNGVIIGGAALWLIDAPDDAQDAAAWQFMKFMAEEAQQATWHTGTGYFPVRTDIDSNADLTSFWAENPNFVTAIDQLATTKTRLDDGSINYAVLGGRAGPGPAIRRNVVEAYSAVLDDGLSAQEALSAAAEKANQELADYNAFFSEGDDANTGSTVTEATEPDTADLEATTLEFWHAMGGELGEVVDELVARFNDSQDVITVNSTYQGSYDDTYNALLAAFETSTEPNIIQNFDLASQTMIDTGRLVPAHQLMDADGFDSSIFVPAVADYYSDDTGMVAMAFNSSTPILYYNVAMMEEAGVSPPPEGTSWSFSEMLAACDAIQASGVTSNCIALGQVGWYFEQILANSGGMYYDNNNGRTGRASEVMFNQGVGVEVFEFLTGLVANGYSPNLGNTWTDTDSVFFAGEAAMMFDSTSGARGLQDGAEFEVGTMFIPYADSAGDRNGVIIGGAALWLIDSADTNTNSAAWEFMKFMAAEAQQVSWHTGTGYFPVRTDISGNSDLNAFWDLNPNFVTAINQLETTATRMDDGSVNYAVLGGRAGPGPAIRRAVVEAYSSVLDDGLSAQEALDIAAEKANQELADYNAFFE